MGNLFGTNPATIYYSSTSFQIPLASRGNRYEDFIAEKVMWTDITRTIRERVKGYRLICQYAWERIGNDDLEKFIDLYNYGGPIYIKFSPIFRMYQVVITNFKRGLADGLQYNDSLEIELQGTKLIDKYPNPDLIICSRQISYKGIMII